jgi:RpiR family transcriptional regulator, carbohydrate utilization regulator
MLNIIEQSRASLRKSERRVADYILAHPNQVIRTSLADLAVAIGVSQPTIIRFCQAIGCEGFREFKLNLAQSLASQLRYFHQSLQTDTRDVPGGDLFARTGQLLTRFRERLPGSELQRAVDVLGRARRVKCFAVGAAESCAFDAQRLLLRHGKSSSAWTEPSLMMDVAGLLLPDDVVLTIFTDLGQEALIPAIHETLRRDAEVLVIAPRTITVIDGDPAITRLDLPDATELECRIVAMLLLALLTDRMARFQPA